MRKLYNRHNRANNKKGRRLQGLGNNKKKNNCLAKIPNEPSPLIRAPAVHTTLVDSKFNMSVSGRGTEHSYNFIPVSNLRQTDNSDGISRTRTSSIDSLSADRSSVSSYHSSTNSGTAFHSPQLNGHCNIPAYNDNKTLPSTAFTINDDVHDQPKEPKKHQRKRKRRSEDQDEVAPFDFRNATGGIDSCGVSNPGVQAASESAIIR